MDELKFSELRAVNVARGNGAFDHGAYRHRGKRV